MIRERVKASLKGAKPLDKYLTDLKSTAAKTAHRAPVVERKGILAIVREVGCETSVVQRVVKATEAA